MMDIVRICDLYFNAMVGLICKKPEYSINRNHEVIKCNHDIKAKEYLDGFIKYYCPNCGVDLDKPEDRIGLEPPITTTERNIHLKKVYGVKRNDFFVCWKCRRTYKAKGKNAISIMKLCPTCRKKRQYDYYSDSYVYDYTWKSNQNKTNEYTNHGINVNMYNINEQLEQPYGLDNGFIQNDIVYDGIGQYLLSKAHKQGFDKVSDVRLELIGDDILINHENYIARIGSLYFNAMEGMISQKEKVQYITAFREYGYIEKAFALINRSMPYKHKKTVTYYRWNLNIIKKGGKYYWHINDKNKGKYIKYPNCKPKIYSNIDDIVIGGTGYRKTSIPLTYQLEYTNWKKRLYGSSYDIFII